MGKHEQAEFYEIEMIGPVDLGQQGKFEAGDRSSIHRSLASALIKMGKARRSVEPARQARKKRANAKG